MPRRNRSVLLVAVVIALGSWACSNTVSTPTPTPPPMTTDTFTGTLTVNGAKVFPFSVAAAGAVAVTLTALTPDSTTTVGLALGTWNGSSCSVVLANDAATQGSVVHGSATVAGSLCIRVYDAAGNLPNTESFTVSVVHP